MNRRDCFILCSAQRVHFFAAFFLFAQAAFILSDIISRYAASFRDTFFFATTGALVGAAVGVAATGAAATAFAALIRAQRAFVASTIRLLPAALSLPSFSVPVKARLLAVPARSRVREPPMTPVTLQSPLGAGRALEESLLVLRGIVPSMQY
jgi:hypothetical protein